MNSEEYIEELHLVDKPLTSRQRKDFVECLSLECLQYCFGDKYRDFLVADKPDIQNRDKTVGIEVTEAISRKEAQMNAEFVKYYMVDEEKSRKRSKTIIEANGGKLDEISLSYPVKNSMTEKCIFQDAIRKKMEKLESYRKNGFAKIDLFIYYDEPPIPFKLEDIKSCFDEVLRNYDDKYDVLFLLFPCGLIRYIISDKDIQISVIGREEYSLLQYNARKTVEKKYS